MRRQVSLNSDRIVRAFFTRVIRVILGEMNRARGTKRHEEIHMEYSAVWPVSCLATKLSVWLATRYYGWITYAPASVCILALLYAYARTQCDYSRKLRHIKGCKGALISAGQY